jgi:hypothetical protein
MNSGTMTLPSGVYRGPWLDLSHILNRAFFVIAATAGLLFVIFGLGKSWGLSIAIFWSSALMLLLVGLLSVGAIYRRVSRAQSIRAEHPWTTNIYYRLFYDMSPLEGALAGALASVISSRPDQFVSLTVIGSVSAAFLVWIVVDPITGLVEAQLPASRIHRARRIKKIECIRKSRQEKRDDFLAVLHEDELRKKEYWYSLLKPEIGELMDVVQASRIDGENTERRVIDIGGRAFRVGGVECMKYLYSIVEEAVKTESGSQINLCHISILWDGIGSWRNRWLDGDYVM